LKENNGKCQEYETMMKAVKTTMEVVKANAYTTDEEILKYEEDGCIIKFDDVSFREIPEKVIEKLSYVNRQNYWVSKGANMAVKRHEKRVDEGFGDIQIVDPLGGKASNKLDTRNVPKGTHVCWKRPDEVDECKDKGYQLVKNDDKIRTPGATATSTSRVIKGRDGKDDLVLMSIPERTFNQHLEAVAFESRKKAGVPLAELKEKVRGVIKGLELKDTTEEVEVSVAQDMKQA
jgi:hypothetical protein